jgi:hypothetical protein
MKIWFTGSHGTGKTTQMEYFLRVHPEFNRLEMERRHLAEQGIIKINKAAAPWDEIVISGCAMLAMLSTSSPFISDRSWVCKCAYAQALPFSQELLEAYHVVNTNSFFGVTEQDKYFYFPPIIELEDDGVRSIDPVYQKEIDYWVQFYLDYFGIPFYTIEQLTVQDRHFEIEKELNKIS